MYTDLKDLVSKVQNNSSSFSPEQVSKDILGCIKYDRKDAVPIIEVAKSMGFKVFLLDSIPNNASGIIVIDPVAKEKFGSNKCVFINEHIKPGKRRFVLAHELAHYLFDFNEKNELRYENAYKKTDKTSDDKCEKKANAFAAALLMPKDLFKKKYEEFRKNTSLSLADVINNLADFFDATAKSVELRLKELDIVVGV